MLLASRASVSVSARTRCEAPYCSAGTPANAALVRLVRASLPDHVRDFSFSTMQLNVGLRPKPHRDSASVGASLTVSLGPFTGGVLWQASTQQPTVFVNDVTFMPPWMWNEMDGACLHGCTPFHGQRCSIVLFTH